MIGTTCLTVSNGQSRSAYILRLVRSQKKSERQDTVQVKEKYIRMEKIRKRKMDMVQSFASRVK